MKKLTIIILSLVVFVCGCVSLQPKDAVTQEVISKPEKIFELKTATLDDIPVYDDTECYFFKQPVTGFNIADCVDKSTFQGYLSHDPQVSIRNATNKKYQVKWPGLNIKKNYMSSTGWVNCEYSWGDSIKMPENLCIKKFGTSISKKKVYEWHSYNDEIDEIEIVNKKKLSAQQRKNLLDKQQKEFSEEYNRYINYYNYLSQKWQEETSALTFCSNIKNEWMDRDCKIPLENFECTSLYFPFAECYKKGFIKLTKEYIDANF